MIAGKTPALLNVPDISQMHFNKLNGMGSQEHNKKLRVERENSRPIRKISKVKVWDIWERMRKQEEEEIKEGEEELKILRENWRVNKKGKEFFETKQKDDKESD